MGCQLKKYVLSRYTYIHQYKDKYLVYNTLNGHFGNIYSAELMDIIEKLINGESIIETDQTKSLIINGFVIQDGFDEFANIFKNFQAMTAFDSLHLIILPTMACNFSCFYCYEKHEPVIMSDETWDKLKSAIRKYVDKNGTKYISLGWFGGEPLLEFKKIRCFYAWFDRFCIEHNITYTSEMTTNGYLIDEEKISFFKQYHINSFQITVDGMSETHDKLRYLKNGSKTWQKVIDNLSLMKSSFGDELRVTLRTNYSIETTHSVFDFFDFVSENFDDRFSISLNAISKLGGENDNQLTYMSGEVISYADLQMLKYLNEKKVDAGATYSIFNPFGMICYAGKANSLVIDPSGRILKCTVELYNSSNVIGDIEDGAFNIDDEKMKQWTEVDLQVLEERKCNICIFLPLCMSRCCGYAHMSGVKRCPIQVAFIDDYLERYYDYLKIGYNDTH